LKTCESKRYAAHSISTAKATSKFLENANAMISSAKPVADAENEEGAAVDSTPVCFMPDLLQDNKAVY